jgi:predicted nuclease with TOPRIM domain
MNDASVYLAISSIVAAMISAFVVVRGQKTSASVDERRHTNAEVQTIFDGYGQIVEELRIEVERLMTTIAILQEEQAACDERNNALIEEVEELKARLSQLESRDG